MAANNKTRRPSSKKWPLFEWSYHGNVEQTISRRIRQKRAQMIVHSYIYYEMDECLISDHTWQEWANELVDLQNMYPWQIEIQFYDEEFKGWDGSTGFHLPRADWVRLEAEMLLRGAAHAA